MVGCYIDMDNEIMGFTVNGVDLGIAFTKFKIPGNSPFPKLIVTLK